VRLAMITDRGAVTVEMGVHVGHEGAVAIRDLDQRDVQRADQADPPGHGGRLPAGTTPVPSLGSYTVATTTGAAGPATARTCPASSATVTIVTCAARASP
jgi:hypothetical protein